MSRATANCRQGSADMAAAINDLPWLGQQLGVARSIMAFVVVVGETETADGIVASTGEAARGLVLTTARTVTHLAGTYLAKDPYHVDTALTERLLRLARR